MTNRHPQPEELVHATVESLSEHADRQAQELAALRADNARLRAALQNAWDDLYVLKRTVSADMERVYEAMRTIGGAE